MSDGGGSTGSTRAGISSGLGGNGSTGSTGSTGTGGGTDSASGSGPCPDQNPAHRQAFTISTARSAARPVADRGASIRARTVSGVSSASTL
ncbi:hypothetical protein ABH926_008404 [Catenulispora sp. GP43]